MAEIVDYDYNPETDGGKFLNLKSKGDKITIRLAGKPISYFVHWIDNKPVMCEDKETCEHCLKVWGVSQAEEAIKQKRKQSFAWAVIDRADGVAKIYKAGIAVYRGIKQYGANPKWGDPTLYDIEIERTEVKPQFYTVTPDPSTLGTSITKEEKAEIAKLDALLDFTTTKDRKEEKVEEVGDEDLPF